MSQPLHSTIQPSRAEDISEKWIAQVRTVVERDGYAMRPGAHFTIEVQNINQPEVWQPLNLETNTAFFATAEDRDAVLAKIWRAPR